MDAELARRQLAKYVGTFRGRALLGPLPLPPAKGRADAPQVCNLWFDKARCAWAGLFLPARSVAILCRLTVFDR